MVSRRSTPGSEPHDFFICFIIYLFFSNFNITITKNVLDVSLIKQINLLMKDGHVLFNDVLDTYRSE